MPRVEGIPEIGGHRVQVSVVDALLSEALYRWLDGNRSVRIVVRKNLSDLSCDWPCPVINMQPT